MGNERSEYNESGNYRTRAQAEAAAPGSHVNLSGTWTYIGVRSYTTTSYQDVTKHYVDGKYQGISSYNIILEGSRPCYDLHNFLV